MIGFGLIVSDDNSLPCCQAVGFQYHWKGKTRQRTAGAFPIVYHCKCRGWNMQAFEELLGENFAAFEACCFRCWSDDRAASVAESVDHAGDQRGFGSDNGEVRAQCGGDGEKRGWSSIAGGNAFGAARDSRIARRCVHSFHFRRLCQFPSKRMFAAAAADYQDPHSATIIIEWRKNTMS